MTSKLLFCCLLIVAGCARNSPSHNSLKISFNIQPTTIDPRLASDFVSSTLVCMIYEGLTRCTPGNGVEAALAERVEISKDQKTYTFYLREAYWTDGTPITAKDFASSWKQILTSASSSSFLFYPIKNGERCAKKEVTADEVGIYPIQDRVLVVELEQPTPYFYSLTAFPSFLPVASHAPDDSNVVSGPFQIEKMSHNNEIVLKKNGNYWNKSLSEF